MLTGEPPFIGDSPVAVAYQHVREDPIPPSRRHPGISPELDAVVLKALAKNPENRYQSAAEMRSDLVRVHSGEAPDAPKILTDDERSSLLATNAVPVHDALDKIPMQSGALAYSDSGRRSTLARWAIAVAVLAVLTVVVTSGDSVVQRQFARDVQVPDVSGTQQQEAIIALQNLGFETRTQKRRALTSRSTTSSARIPPPDRWQVPATSSPSTCRSVPSSADSRRHQPDVRRRRPRARGRRLRTGAAARRPARR